MTWPQLEKQLAHRISQKENPFLQTEVAQQHLDIRQDINTEPHFKRTEMSL